MFVPYGTDAPIYYLPFATGAMIAANVLAFAGIVSIESQVDEEQFGRIVGQLILIYGEGLRPWQWISSNFMHADFGHLLGNMFGLWAFGIIIEGKIGWWRFLAIFFAIGVTQCAVEQTLMLFVDEGGSLGASSIIFGLMAIALLWAPKNEMNCFYWFGFMGGTTEVAISTLVGVSLAIQLATGVFSGMEMSSQMLHLMGAGLGFGIGILLLRKNWVDCEGWDVFTLWKGDKDDMAARDRENEAAKALIDDAHAKRTATAILAAAPPDDNFDFPVDGADLFGGDFELEDPLAEIQNLIASKRPADAFARHQQAQLDSVQWRLPEPDLLQIIGLFHKQKQWSASIPSMQEYLATYATREAQVRIKLAHILLEASKQPALALETLLPLNPAFLTDSEAVLFRKIEAAANRQAGGV